MTDSAYVAMIEPWWDRINIYDDPQAFADTFAVAPTKVRVLLPAHLTLSEVCNGGFWQFYWNSSGVLAPEAAEAFDALGMTNLANIVRATMRFFGPDYPRDRDERIAALSKYENEHRTSENADKSYLSAFEVADDAFFAVMEQDGGGFDVATDRYVKMDAVP